MKRFLLPLLLLSTACSSQKDWNYQEVVSKSSQFDSALLQYHSANELTGVGVELIKGSFGTLGYLNVVARQIPPLPDNPETAIVVFEIDDEKIPYKAERMKGGQRLLLPDEATEKLIATLKSNQTITIYLNGYMTKLEQSNFSKCLKKFSAR